MKSSQEAIRKIISSIGIGIVVYFIVGFGGCAVRIVATNTWIKNNSPSSTFDSYTHEAVIAFVVVIGIGIFSALRKEIQPQLSTTINRYFSLGFKAGLIAFPVAAIIVFGFAGFSPETKTESKTGRFYTIMDYNGINLKGNQYSKNDMIEVLEETENAVCLKLPSGRECYPTPLVLQRAGKTNVDSILRHGNVDTKTVQNKQIVTSAVSAFFGNLLISCVLAFMAAISTIFISRYISAAPDQQHVLGLGGGGSQTNYSSAPNNPPPISSPSSTRNYSTSSSSTHSTPRQANKSRVELEEFGKKANAKFSGVKNEIQSLARQLQISFPVDYISKGIQKTIDAHGTQLLINSSPLDKVVTNLKQKATEDKTNLDKANNLLQTALGFYADLTHKAKETSDKFLSEQLEDIHSGLNSNNLKSFLLQRRWNDYYDILESIIETLQDLRPETEETKAYRILGVPPTATDEQIKKIYWQLAKIYHSDTGDFKNEDKIKEINWAYGILKNRNKSQRGEPV